MTTMKTNAPAPSELCLTAMYVVNRTWKGQQHLLGRELFEAVLKAEILGQAIRSLGVGAVPKLVVQALEAAYYWAAEEAEATFAP